MIIKQQAVFLFITFLTIVVSTVLHAASLTVPMIDFEQENLIHLDGLLNEPAWQSAILISDFKEVQPFSQNPAAWLSEVRLISSEQGLYIAFINKIAISANQQTTLRDNDIKADYVEVIIDFGADAQAAYGFQISRDNTIQDAIWNAGNTKNIDWDGNWQHAVHSEKTQWTSEVFIPWSVAPMYKTVSKDKTITIYLSNWNHAAQRRSAYPAINSQSKSFIETFADLNVIMPEVNQFDAFVYGSINHQLNQAETDYRAGVDMFWQPSVDNQLNMTLNPDFGQVESNNLVINLTAIEDFFSEKRPFFSENNEMFDLQGPESLYLVHTPRIGGEFDSQSLKAVDVEYALRYSLINKNIGFSVLSAKEEDEGLSYFGRRYLASRVFYLNQQMRLGFTNTQVKNSSDNRQSNVNAVDLKLSINKKLQVTAMFIQSTIDDNNLQKNDQGWWITNNYQYSDTASHEITLLNYGQFLDISDFGYVKRVNRKQFEYEGSLLWPNLSSEYFRDAELGYQYQTKTNYQQQDLADEAALNLTLTNKDTSSISLEYEYISNGVDDLLTRGNNAVAVDQYQQLSLSHNSQQKSNYHYSLTYEEGEGGDLGHYRSYQYAPTIDFDNHISLGFSFEYAENNGAYIWLTDNTVGVFAADSYELGISLSARYQKRHEFRFSLESVVLIAEAQSQFDVNAQGEHVSSNITPESINISELAMQLRYRYEISSLSELFLVYNRGGEYGSNITNESSRYLIKNSYFDETIESVYFKLKFHF